MLKNLKNLRKELNLSQTQIAEKLHISQQTYSDYENCKTEPAGEMLIQIDDFFEVSVDELLGRETEKSLRAYDQHELTDRQQVDLLKMYKLLTEIQKAQVFGYVLALLEEAGVNVKSVLGH